MRLALLLAVVLLAAPAGAAPDVHGLLAYSATGGIEVIRADGSGTHLLAAGRPGDFDPRWSPDGRRIAVWYGDGDLALVDLAGHRTVVTDDDWVDRYPVWTADGSRLVFDSDRGGTDDRYLWSIRPDGTGAKQLEFQGSIYAAIAPTGALAFNASYGTTIRVAPSITARSHAIPQSGWAPAWWPDGTRLVYEMNSDNSDDPRKIELYSVNPDGSQPRRLTHNQVDDSDASVSPDGKTIAFVTSRFGWDEIELADADGSHQRRLTHQTDGGADDASWQP